MKARYIVRLDDACSTMDHCRWNVLESVLDEFAIRPLVAVIPENRDPGLIFDEVDPKFWERVRKWQAKGWAIGMHGLHHLYHSVDRRRLILPFYDRSEVAGLDLSGQAALIATSWALFTAQGIRPTAWIAPSHSFDSITMQALAQETPIRLISDGPSIEPFSEGDFHWVPQQLWAPAPKRRGVWTICLHPNTMTDADIDRLREKLAEPFYRTRMTCLADLSPHPPRRSLRDRAYHHYFMARHRTIPLLLPIYHAIRQLWRRVVR